MHVALPPNAHGGGHRQVILQALLDRPLDLLDVLVLLRHKIQSNIFANSYHVICADSHLAKQEVHLLGHENVDLLHELLLHVGLGAKQLTGNRAWFFSVTEIFSSRSVLSSA